MRVFVTGVNGQLGHDVMNELLRRGHEGIGSDLHSFLTAAEEDCVAVKSSYVSLDITDKNAVSRTIEVAAPDAVIHCAAWTAVDLAEEEENMALVRSVNVDGTDHIAAACKQLGCKMLYISTDYVFDGQGTCPWEADCRDFHPLNVYGQTKLEGELAVSRQLEKFFIVRTAWVFGLHGKNFVKTMIEAGKHRSEVRVVNDQIGTPI